MARFRFRGWISNLLGVRVIVTTFVTLIAVEALVFIPICLRREAELQTALERMGLAEVATMLRHAGDSIKAGSLDDDLTGPFAGTVVKGLRVYAKDGSPLSTMGETPDFVFEASKGVQRRAIEGKRRLEIFWPAEVTNSEFHATARLDTTMIHREVSQFLRQVLYLSLLFGTVASLVILATLDHLIIHPIRTLRTNLANATLDLSKASKYRMETKRKDELGELTISANHLLDSIEGNVARLNERQAMLADSQARLSAIFNASYLPIFLVDPKTERIVEANRAAHETLQVAPDSLPGRRMAEFHSQEMPELRKFMSSVTANGTAQTCSLHCETEPGAIIPAEMFASKLTLSGKRLVMVVVRDLTESRQQELKLLEAKEQAELANRAKSQFLANVSHELRTPLNAINGFSEVIHDQLFGPIGNERYRLYAQHILESGKHLLEIINDILDLSKIEAGQQLLSEEQVGIAECVKSCLALVSARANDQALTLVSDIPDDLPDLWADKRAIKQILLNLLSNAVKFTNPGGQVVVRAHITEAGEMCLSVKDTGIGIAESELEVVMRPFGQVDHELSRRHEGTGLGLPLSQSFAELHGGHLVIDSTLGEGTTVSAYFPAERVIASSQRGSTAAAS